MQALDLLINRRSHAKLTAPAPSGVALEQIFAAGLRAPDHGHLTPWRFIVAEQQGLQQLGDLFAEAEAQQAEVEPAKVERARSLPLRAPMVIIAVAVIRSMPKVPPVEQLLSAGCAVHAMQMAALAQGYGGVWRTGPYAHSDFINQRLGLAEHESIVGFLYLGTPAAEPAKAPLLSAQDFVSYLK